MITPDDKIRVILVNGMDEKPIPFNLENLSCAIRAIKSENPASEKLFEEFIFNRSGSSYTLEKVIMRGHIAKAFTTHHPSGNLILKSKNVKYVKEHIIPKFTAEEIEILMRVASYTEIITDG